MRTLTWLIIVLPVTRVSESDCFCLADHKSFTRDTRPRGVKRSAPGLTRKILEIHLVPLRKANLDFYYATKNTGSVSVY